MKDLDEYLDKAARQNEIVPLAEIEDMLSSKTQHAEGMSHHQLYPLLFRRKALVFATISVAIILAGSVITLMVHPDETRVDEEIFVPYGQRRVMRLVKNIAARRPNGEIAISQFGSTPQSEASGIPIHLRSKFELSEDKLKLLGIRFFDEYIQYEGNVKGKGYVAFRVLKTGSKHPADFYPLEVDGLQRPGVKVYEFYPWFMTDEAGYQGFRYRFRDEPALKTTSSFFLSAMDELIPIEINRQGFEKVIFWFSQTPELMNILESAARISKRMDIPEDQKTTGTMNTIRIEIFPTITHQDVQIVANILKKQTLEITLLNSSGEVLTIPVNNQVLKEGTHNFSMDLSNLKKGLYFVRIKSDPGLITIHRLFKE